MCNTLPKSRYLLTIVFIIFLTGVPVEQSLALPPPIGEAKTEQQELEELRTKLFSKSESTSRAGHNPAETRAKIRTAQQKVDKEQLDQCLAAVKIDDFDLTGTAQWTQSLAKAKSDIQSKLVPCIEVYAKTKTENNASQAEKVSKELKVIRTLAIDTVKKESTRAALDKSFTLTYKQLAELDELEKSVSNQVNDALDFNALEYIIPSWRNEAFSFQFYTGLEATNVNELFEETNTRLGFQGYHRFTNEIEKFRADIGGVCVADRKCHEWFWPGVHLFGSATITAVGENTFVSNKQDVMSESETQEVEADGEQESTDESSIERALVGEFGLYLPVYVAIRGNNTQSNYQEFTIGPILSVGFNFTDNSQERFNTRYYAGARFAHNEETYFDILYGKNEGIAGNRVEARGQLPVTTFAGGRLFLGGRFNAGIDERKDEAEDAWQIYVQWQTSFDTLWKNRN